MTLCDHCLGVLTTDDIDGICFQCWADWTEYQASKRDDEPRDD